MLHDKPHVQHSISVNYCQYKKKVWDNYLCPRLPIKNYAVFKALFLDNACSNIKNIKPIIVRNGATNAKFSVPNWLTTTPPIAAPNAFPILNADWFNVLASIGAS